MYVASVGRLISEPWCESPFLGLPPEIAVKL